VVARLHHRMPVMLESTWEGQWLDSTLTDRTTVLDLLRQSNGVAVEAYPVSRRVNAARDDDAALIERV